MKEEIHSLDAISSVDGRYCAKLSELSKYLSEGGLISSRLRVEAEWFNFLGKILGQKYKADAPKNLDICKFMSDLGKDDLKRVKSIESQIKHDVKAVEYFLREKLSTDYAVPERFLPLVHFACTSEDINNLAYALLLKDLKNEVLLPILSQLISKIKDKTKRYSSLAMLARTHGQPASPTTLGKEFAVFGSRLQRQLNVLERFIFQGKINGAVGNFNAHVSALPEIDWLKASQEFVEKKLGLGHNPLTTQIENHDNLSEFIDLLKRINVILLGFCQDIWAYIAISYFKLVSKPGEVGSSTMPHKINPIDFENAEGNLGVAIALGEFFTRKLPISRWQRDLSDSTVLRNIGSFIAHSVLAYKAINDGLDKIEPDRERINEDIVGCWEVLGEALQTSLRLLGVGDAYERIKDLTRGRKLTKDLWQKIVADCQELDETQKKYFMKLTPDKYIGLADKLAKMFTEEKFEGEA